MDRAHEANVTELKLRSRAFKIETDTRALVTPKLWEMSDMVKVLGAWEAAN